jgi:origin recognition complex subunit 1
MPNKPSKSTHSTKVERARQYLSGGGVTREDSDDELGLEDHPWQWIYSKDRQGMNGEPGTIGARMGNFQCMIGDCVLLKAEGTGGAWIGLICDFQDDDEEDEKAANFMWFSTEREIRNKQKKRMDSLPVHRSNFSIELR